MSNNSSDETEVIRVASEIKRYLGDHPKGADSIDGITKWWLPRQRLEESTLLVRKVLDYLVSERLRSMNAGFRSDFRVMISNLKHSDELS